MFQNFVGPTKLSLSSSFQSITVYFTGQKSRVSFAVLAYQRPHLLIIDEGSNHLSMDAVDALIDAIRDFKGKEKSRNLFNHRALRQFVHLTLHCLTGLNRRPSSSKSRPIFRD